MYRFRPRYNPDVNQYWMCDEGRLWYKELQKESRIMRPFVRGEQDFVAATWDRAISSTVKALTESKLKSQLDLSFANVNLASAKLDVTFRGRAAHAGARPEDGRNALLDAASAVVGLYGIARHHAGL